MKSLSLNLIYICLCFYTLQLSSQKKDWNLIIESETNTFYNCKVIETDSFYFVTGRAGIKNYGFSVFKVDKRNGSTLTSALYEEKDVNMDSDYSSEWYLDGSNLLLPQVTWRLPAYINLFSVNVHTLEIEKIVEIPVPDDRSMKSMRIYDFKKIEGDYYILGLFVIGEYGPTDNEVYPLIIKYSPITKEHKVILLGEGNDRYGLHKMIGLNGHIYVFASEANENYIAEAKQVIYCLNLEGKMIWKYITPNMSPIYDVCDVYPLNEREVLLASYDSRFTYSDRRLWSRWTVTRYDLETNQEIWSTYWNEPGKKFIGYAKIVPTKESGEYLLACNDEVSTDTEDYSIGKVVRFTDAGQRIWQKTYYNNNSKRGLINDFGGMIPTSDGNYLIVGWVNWGGGFPWLVKIDDDGNVLPIDTTTSVEDVEVTKEIKIVPNPWDNETQIHFYMLTEGVVFLNIMDMNGKVVYTHHEYLVQGENTLKVSVKDIPISGMLMYELKFGNQTKVGKMLNIR